MADENDNSLGDTEDREDAMFGRLFDDEPAPNPDKAVAPVEEKAAPEKAAPEKTEKVEPPAETEEADPDAEEDYDKPVDKKVKVEDEDPERDPKDETAARKQAKENGRKLKETAALLQERDLELEAARTEAAEARKQADIIKKARVKPMEDPGYKKLHDDILTEVSEASELLPETQDVPKHFGSFITSYLEARTAKNRSEVIETLKQDIIAKCGKFDIPYEDMDSDEKRDADRIAAGVMTILRSTSGRVQEALDLANTLTSDSEDGEVILRERDYSATVAGIDPVLSGLGEMEDDLIESTPYAVESLIARMVKDSPDARRRSEAAKRDIKEAFAGPRPLTKDEITKLKKEGTDIKKFESERMKTNAKKREKLIAHLYRGLMMNASIPKMAEELDALKGKKQADESERDALRSITQKKPVTKPKEPVPAGGRRGTPALDELTGGGGDDDDD